MEEKRNTGVWIAVAVLLLPLALYIGSYFAMLDPDSVAARTDPDYIPVQAAVTPQQLTSCVSLITEPSDNLCLYPCYRYDSAWVEWVFYPAWRVDKRLRPERWQF